MGVDYSLKCGKGYVFESSLDREQVMNCFNVLNEDEESENAENYWGFIDQYFCHTNAYWEDAPVFIGPQVTIEWDFSTKDAVESGWIACDKEYENFIHICSLYPKLCDLFKDQKIEYYVFNEVW